MIKLKNLINKTKLLREVTGTTQLTQTAKYLANLLYSNDIPHFIIGGYAVQEYGYARTTIDIDIIVPNRQDTIDYLSIRGFKEVRGNKMKIIDRSNGVEVDVLEGGEKLNTNSKIPLPIPTIVSDKPTILNFKELIELKLDAYSTTINRLQDGSDVGKLIVLHKLPLNLYKKLNTTVQDVYKEIWKRYTESK